MRTTDINFKNNPKQKTLIIDGKPSFKQKRNLLDAPIRGGGVLFEGSPTHEIGSSLFN